MIDSGDPGLRRLFRVPAWTRGTFVEVTATSQSLLVRVLPPVSSGCEGMPSHARDAAYLVDVIFGLLLQVYIR